MQLKLCYIDTAAGALVITLTQLTQPFFVAHAAKSLFDVRGTRARLTLIDEITPSGAPSQKT